MNDYAIGVHRWGPVQFPGFGNPNLPRPVLRYQRRQTGPGLVRHDLTLAAPELDAQQRFGYRVARTVRLASIPGHDKISATQPH